MKHKILLDISFGALGYSGIPQDNRLMYSTFAQSKKIDVTGLFFKWGRATPSVLRKSGSREVDELGSSSLILGDILVKNGISLGLSRHPSHWLKSLFYLRHLIRNRPILWDVPVDMLGDAVWRQLFSKTLTEEEHYLIRKGKFVTGDFSLLHILDRTTIFDALGPFKLKTDGYDFAIFHDSRRIQVSPNTKKIIRYHDAIPVTQPDTVDPSFTRLHLQALRYCAKDSFFVCNSEPVLEDLVRLHPTLEKRSTVIPYRIAQTNKQSGEQIPVVDIVQSRISFVALGNGANNKTTDRVESRIRILEEKKEFPKFILAVSTLEPRKNFVGLIRAWERVLATCDSNLKLIIVGAPGWIFEETLAAMKTRVASGQLLHLVGVPFAELQVLYQQAECLVFPSFAEGYGFPPVEAMVQGTPSVVSDIPVHRWVMEDAAIYANPYNIDDIADQIERMIYADDSKQLRMDLCRRGQRILAKYDRQVIDDQWCNLFERLRADGGASK